MFTEDAFAGDAFWLCSKYSSNAGAKQRMRNVCTLFATPPLLRMYIRIVICKVQRRRGHGDTVTAGLRKKIGV
jgi:hypothetical protein